MASATRWTIRQEPYDPDARDADNDGIVQEQTPWERPAGTSLVDELGRAITRGANAGQRPRGLRVVDQRGNPVDYTPTYERPGFAFGGGGTPLGEAGAPSLRERGLPSVRDITAPQPTPQPEPSLAPTLPSAAVLSGADTPESPALRVDGRPKASAKEMAEASRIAKSIQESVEAEFGPLETKQQVRDALNRAFPTASGNAEALLNSAEYWDENPPRVKAVRNFAIGLLHMSQQDPQTARRISRLTDLDTKDPNAGGVHMTRFDTYSGMIQSWAIAMNPWLNVNSLEPDKREMGEPWAYKMALSMKETGEFSDDEINQVLQQSVAIHEFGHAMHLNAGLSHWGNDRGGVIPAEAMIQAFANVEKISVSDANDQINAYIQKNFTVPRSQETISEAITSLVRPKTGVEQAFVYELYDTIKWDGVDGDEATRSKILEDLSKASEYATTGGKRGQGSQYDEDIAETIAVMVATGTAPSGGEETLAHVQSIFPGAAAPPTPPEPDAPKPSLKGKSRAEIEKRNDEIRQNLKSVGAATGRQDAAYKEANDPGGHYAIQTVEEVAEARNELVNNTIADIRAILTGNEDDRLVGPDGVSRRVDMDSVKRLIEGVDPVTADLILNSTDEELKAILTEQSMVLHQSFLRDRVEMMMPAERLDGLLSTGAFKSTHEVDSSQSAADVRTMYEVSRMGLPVDTPAELRPIHGWLTTQEHLDAGDEYFDTHQRESDKQDPRLAQDWTGEEFAAGPVEDVYGRVRVTLRPGMEGRTSYTMGDSIRANPKGVVWLDETDEDVITNQMIMGRDMIDPQERIIRLLDQRRTGNTRDFLQSHRGGTYDGEASRTRIISGRTYWESQVYGGIDLTEVSEVTIPVESIQTPDFRLAGMAARVDAELRDSVTEEFFGADKMRALGLSDEEIAWLQSNWDGSGFMNSADVVRMIRDHRRREELSERFSTFDVKVTYTSRHAMDVMDPANYTGSKPGQSVEEVLTDRLYGSIVEDTRKAIEQERERAERAARGQTGESMM